MQLSWSGIFLELGLEDGRWSKDTDFHCIGLLELGLEFCVLKIGWLALIIAFWFGPTFHVVPRIPSRVNEPFPSDHDHGTPYKKSD